MQTEVITFIEHKGTFPVNTRYGPRTKNTFVSFDGREFEAWNAEVATVVQSLLNTPTLVSYEVKQNGQFTNYDLKEATPAAEMLSQASQTAPVTTNGPIPTQDTPEAFFGPVKPVDRNAGLARAIEFFGVAGINPTDSFAELFELADKFARYGALGELPTEADAANPSIVTTGPTT